MAGTLTVQNLQGPSSGANANKIIVPSGQTIDASAGTLVPSADQVVQYKWYPNPTTFDSTASAYTTAQLVYFTPKKSGNLIMARFGGHLYKINNSTYPSSIGRLAIDGSQVWQSSYITYHDASYYMYTFSAVGAKLATDTNAIAVEFSINPNGHRTYLYGNTGGMEVWEVAQ